MRIAWALPAAVALVCGCSAGLSAPQAASQSPSTPRASATASPTPSASGGPELFRPTRTGILRGKVVAVDPGHNGGNFDTASAIGKLIWNGRESETCDTTGAETDGGYTEAQFNWDVALFLTADLRAEGATVVLTRTSNTGVGPCVTERAAIGNEVHANAAISIHADGGPPGGRGFASLEPVADGPDDAIIGPSVTLGADLRAAFASGSGEPLSSYDGTGGITRWPADPANVEPRSAGPGGARRRSRSQRFRGTGRRSRPRSAAALLVPGGTAGRPRHRARSPGCRPPGQATRWG